MCKYNCSQLYISSCNHVVCILVRMTHEQMYSSTLKKNRLYPRVYFEYNTMYKLCVGGSGVTVWVNEVSIP